MCGIAGTVSPLVSDEVLRAMARCIAHRGPDDEGIFRAPGVGLAFRRLAIVDIATGKQPMSTPDGALTVVFNGEIYNHRDIRRQLESLGHRFATDHSDTETLLHGLRAWGIDGLCSRIHGQFAFAIWDAGARKLHLGRDRVGKKPLFIAQADGEFAFASEIKALTPLPWWSRDLDHEALWDYLSLQYVPPPGTIFRGVRHLPAGHCATYDPATGKLETKRYWRLEYEPKHHVGSCDCEEEEHVEFLPLFEQCVADRLESEVPLGVFLSGGIDSSAVVAMMRRHMPGELRTFSIGFREEKFDELPHAREVAKLFSTRHEEFVVEPDAAEILPKLAHHFDQPFADPAAVPTWYLCQMARKHVTVALNGDGGDESFVGYPRTLGFAPIPGWSRVPRALRVAFGAFLRDANRAEHPFIALRHAEFVNHQSLVSPERNFANMMAWMSDDTKQSVAGRGLRNAASRDTLAEVTIRAIANAPARTRIDRFLSSDIGTYLEGALLPKVDRVSMACGLEARSPFLDYRLMEFAAQLPLSVKLPAREPKAFLRDALRTVLPSSILDRPKAGFAVPIGPWLKGPLRAMTRDLLLDCTARQRGLFRPGAIERLLREHASGAADHKRAIWVLLNLEVWLRTDLPISP